jgi:hypothetical protein
MVPVGLKVPGATEGPGVGLGKDADGAADETSPGVGVGVLPTVSLADGLHGSALAFGDPAGSVETSAGVGLAVSPTFSLAEGVHGSALAFGDPAAFAP